MEQEQKDKFRNLIAEELAAPGLAITPPPYVPQPPPQPHQAVAQTQTAPQSSEVSLDEYEALMVDALLYRIDAADKTQALLNIEKKSISEMRDSILSRCVKRLGVDTAKYNVLIQADNKMVKIEERS